MESDAGQLAGKVALVTGGSRGIGAATCKALASRGSRVVVNYVRNAVAAERIVDEIAAGGGSARAVRANVLDEGDVAHLFREVIDAFGGLDVVVSNAAMDFELTPFSAITWDDFIGKVDDELRAAFLVTRHALPLLREHGSGRLIYISSETANSPGSPATVAHGTAKAALEALVRYVALEFAPLGITANVVSAGLIRTEGSAAVPERYLEQVESLVPLGRLGAPDDIADVVAFLASEDSRFITGACTRVLGGQGLGRSARPPS